MSLPAPAKSCRATAEKKVTALEHTGAGSDAIVLGAGLAGLAAGYTLARAGRRVLVFERETAVGGLARTLEHCGQRFDLGGHRLLTDNLRVQQLVQEVVRDPLLRVPRASTILLGGRYFEYPLRTLNAVAGLGVATTLRVLHAYAAAQLRHRLAPRVAVSLEDWVVRHYGRALFEIFFRPYSEKVWGIDCTRISADWVAQRIQGLTLGMAIQRALRCATAGAPRTLATEFLYPRRGIGAIAEGLRARIDKPGAIFTGSCVTRVLHRANRIECVEIRHGDRVQAHSAEEFLSSLPLPVLAKKLWPFPPRAVREAAGRLRYRDLLLVAVRARRERATDRTWIYVPERHISFGRVHEPKNWSPYMGPPGQTLLVTEHFCFRADATWCTSDDALLARSIDELASLGLIRHSEAVDGVVVRIPCAYPLFDLGYADACNTIADYLGGFVNLRVIGRTGAFRYYNMDHAIESGLAAADAILARTSLRETISRGLPMAMYA